MFRHKSLLIIRHVSSHGMSLNQLQILRLHGFLNLNSQKSTDIIIPGLFAQTPHCEDHGRPVTGCDLRLIVSSFCYVCYDRIANSC
jgi:hypothetical protein